MKMSTKHLLNTITKWPGLVMFNNFISKSLFKPVTKKILWFRKIIHHCLPYRIPLLVLCARSCLCELFSQLWCVLLNIFNNRLLHKKLIKWSLPPFHSTGGDLFCGFSFKAFQFDILGSPAFVKQVKWCTLIGLDKLQHLFAFMANI